MPYHNNLNIKRQGPKLDPQAKIKDTLFLKLPKRTQY